MKQNKMWHEARKQEKKIRGMMVDYKKRAERRREYYERIKKDPAQFLQVHGRASKIHIDPSIAQAAEGPITMMPWQGKTDNMIDRFDVRAHLDIIPEYKPPSEPPKLSSEEQQEERQANYERYRTLVLNDFIGVSEGKFLNQIFMEERYGPSLKSSAEEEKKKLAEKKAAIGYVYEDSDPPLPTSNRNLSKLDTIADELDQEDEDKDDLSDIDLDVAIDVNQLTNEQGKEMNQHGHKYGMLEQDFISFLYQDKEEAEQLKLARELEEEKAMFSGRKSRRERRALRDKKLQGRKVTSPPSYAARESPRYKPFRMQLSPSRSPTPENAGQITFITSFGGDHSDDEKASTKVTSSKPTTSSSKWSKEASSQEPLIGPQLPSSSLEKRNIPVHISKRKGTRSPPKYRGSRGRRHSSSSKSASRSPPPKTSSTSTRRKLSHSSSSSSHSRSASPTEKQSATPKSRSRSRSKPLPSPPRKTYYRRSLSKSSDDDSSLSSEEDEGSDSRSKPLPSLPKVAVPLASKAGPTSKMTPQERLKRKMQLALNKHYKADKKAEQEKKEKQKQELQERADELRDMAIKLRQKERERRHRMRETERDRSSDSNDDDSSSRGGARYYGEGEEGDKSRPDSPDRYPYSSRDNYRRSEKDRSPEESRPPRELHYRSNRYYYSRRYYVDDDDPHKDHHRSEDRNEQHRKDYRDDDRNDRRREHRSDDYRNDSRDYRRNRSRRPISDDDSKDYHSRHSNTRHRSRSRSRSRSRPSHYSSSRSSRHRSRYSSRSPSQSRTRERPLVDY